MMMMMMMVVVIIIRTKTSKAAGVAAAATKTKTKTTTHYCKGLSLNSLRCPSISTFLVGLCETQQSKTTYV
jgi:hypothetical protein